MTFDPLALIERLAAGGVHYALIGGIAGRVLGSVTVTNDLDICYDRVPDNLERLARALHDLHATLRGAPPDLPFRPDAEALQAGDAFTLDTDLGALDLIGTPAGTRGYADLRAGASEYDLGGFTVWVCSLEDLMRMKTAAGRAKDRIELEVLGALRDELEGRPGL